MITGMKLLILQMKCELKKFGTNRVNITKDLLTTRQFNKIKNFRENEEITVRKTDKSNVFVILNISYCHTKLDAMLADSFKFQKIKTDPTDKLKTELTKLITQANKLGDPMKFAKREGYYETGYIYGNPKIHKSLTEPPLRPMT